MPQPGASSEQSHYSDEGCTAANRWCEASEPTQNAGLGCSAARDGPAHSGETELVLVVVIALVGLAVRRRPSRREIGPIVVVVLGVFAVGRPAFADVVPKATPEEQQRLEARRLGVLVGGGISIDKAGYDVAVGVRYDLGRRFTVGLGLEYNPWFSIEAGRTVAGTTQGYGVGVFRLDVRDYLELHTTLAAGVSVMMFDTFAAPKGSYGPYVAVSPLGVSFRMSDRFRLLVEPGEIVIPIPQTTGIPLVYRQHRLSVALQTSF